MRNGLAALSLLFTAACWVPMPEQEILPPSDAGFDAGVWVCGPGTCAGCCDEGRCVRGVRESACGHSGEACVVCGEDALCGPSNTCEEQDPNRYGSGTPNSGQPSNTGSTCRVLNGAWVCW